MSGAPLSCVQDLSLEWPGQICGRFKFAQSSFADKLSVVDFCKRLKACLYRLARDPFFWTKIDNPAIQVFGNSGAARNRDESCESEKAPTSNVVSVAKNDQLNNLVAMGCREGRDDPRHGTQRADRRVC